MAALDFPASPTVGQIYTANGKSWKWDGVSWVSANLITSIGVTGSTMTIYGSPIAHPDATSLTFANSVALTAASTKTLTLNGGGGSNGLVLDASNNVGIGTGSPLQILHVKKDQAAYTWARVDNQFSSASAYSGFMLGAFGNSWGISIGSSSANSNALTFVLDAGGTNTEKMRLDSSGNLGLGVTPSAWYSGIKAIEIGSKGNAFFSGGASEVDMCANAYYVGGPSYTYGTSTYASRYQQINSQHIWFTAGSGTAGNAISFTQAMTLDASGCLGIGSGATSPSSNAWITSVASPITRPLAALYSNAASDSASALLQLGKYANDSTTANLFVRFYINNLTNGSGTINANGAGSAAFGAYSDARLKENIVDLEPQLSNILALRPTEFDYIESEGGGHQIGFIAQDMEKVYPDAVGEREDGMKTITGWSKTEARLVKAIQEMHQEIESLKARIN